MTISEIRRRLDCGEVSSRELCDAALARIDDPSGEGSRTFTVVFHDAARAAADAADALRRNGVVLSPLAGVTVSVKDLFDVAGTVTRAGSVILADAPPAARDATVVARLRRAGAVIVGKTNMTEFAFSGIGLNPHYGTPRNPYDRATGRIPGGSSSGAAVSVSDGMAAVGIGTDTGGSVRIPAVLCGIAGFKPTAKRVPTDGAYPLSFTLDSVGPLAPSLACCATVDAILAGNERPALGPAAVRGLRLLAPTNYVREELEPVVAAAFAFALERLREGGAMVDEAPVPLLERVPGMQVNAGLSGAESFWWHRGMLAAARDRYDPRIASRIERGAEVTATDYIQIVRGRRALIADFATATADYDALVWPTVPIVAPAISPLERDDAVFARTNALLLRNTSVVNLLDGCAATLPIPRASDAPTGLMIVGRHGEDQRLLQLALGIEATLDVKLI